MSGELSDTKALFDEFGGRLFQYFYKKTGGNIQAAHDCVKELFARLGERLMAARIEDPRAELLRIAREVADHRQRRSTKSKNGSHPVHDLGTKAIGEDPMAKPFATQVVKWARLNLPAEQLVAFLAWTHGDTRAPVDRDLRSAFQSLQREFGDQVLALYPGQFGHHAKSSPQ